MLIILFKKIDLKKYDYNYTLSMKASVAELADAPDLGSGAARRGGSSPFARKTRE